MPSITFDMPNFYTHIRFARETVSQLSPELQNALEAEYHSFLLGNFGPDPLYFGGKALREKGLSLHNGSGKAALGLYRYSVTANKPYARSFVAGYFLHFLLDSRLHPLVYEAMEQTGLTHRNLEGELDRLFLTRDNVALPVAFPKVSLPEAFYMTAARMAPGVTPQDYRMGLQNFRRVSLGLSAATGTPLRFAANGLSRISGIQGLRGAVLAREPDSSAVSWLFRLEGRYQETLKIAPQALKQFLLSMERDLPLSPILDCNFSGKKDF